MSQWRINSAVEGSFVSPQIWRVNGLSETHKKMNFVSIFSTFLPTPSIRKYVEIGQENLYINTIAYQYLTFTLPDGAYALKGVTTLLLFSEGI